MSDMLREQLERIFAADERIVEVVEYRDGFVPNSYHWPAPGTKIVHPRVGAPYEASYDRKRSHGRGPRWTAFSARRGVLATG